MGVSVRTSDRILKRDPVDRASLVTAFRPLGAPWADEYLEKPPTDSLETEGAAPPAAETSNSLPVAARRPSTLLFVGLSVLVLTLIVGIILGSRPRDWRPEFMAEMERATEHYHRAEFKDARESIDRAAKIAHPHRQADALAWMRRLEAEILAAEGNKEEALERIQIAVAYLKDLDIPDQYYGALEVAANYKAVLGRVEEARADHLECLAYGQRVQDRYVIATACRGLGELSMRKSAHNEAIEWFDKGIKSLGSGFEDETSLDLRARKAIALAHLKRFKEALPILQEALIYWEKKGHPRWVAASHHRLGIFHKLKGDQVTADIHFTQARDGYLRVGDRRGADKSEQELSLADGE